MLFAKICILHKTCNFDLCIHTKLCQKIKNCLLGISICAIISIKDYIKSSVYDSICKLFFLILGIGDRLAKAGAFAMSQGIYDLIDLIEQRFHLFLPHLKYLLSAVFSLLCFLFVVSCLADQGNYLCRGAGGISLGYAVEEVSPANIKQKRFFSLIVPGLLPILPQYS